MVALGHVPSLTFPYPQGPTSTVEVDLRWRRLTVEVILILLPPIGSMNTAVDDIANVISVRLPRCFS